MHWNDPPNMLIPAKDRAAQEREKQEQRRRLALAAAESAGRHDAKGELVKAEQDWQDVSDFLGARTIPRVFVRARRSAARGDR
jgi:hypothetical protein